MRIIFASMLSFFYFCLCVSVSVGLSVCLYRYVHLCMSIGRSVCLSVCLSVCKYLCMYISVVSMNLCVHADMYLCTHNIVYAYEQERMYICVRSCMFEYICGVNRKDKQISLISFECRTLYYFLHTPRLDIPSPVLAEHSVSALSKIRASLDVKHQQLSNSSCNMLNHRFTECSVS